MPPRPFWKGYLKLSLVTCPVGMIPAVSESEKIRFHTINRATGNRIQSRYVDAVTQRPVGEDNIVKGYQRGPDDYLILEDRELESVALESTRTIDIERFVPKASVAQLWYDTPHFLLPIDKVGEEAFAVIREAMRATGMVGLSRLVLHRRERAVMLDPRDKGIILWTLHYRDEVRDAAATADSAESKPDRKLLKMVETLIDQRIRPWSDDLVTDPVQDRLHEIVAAKQHAAKPPKAKPAAEPAPDNVVNIMEALRDSLRGKKG